MTLQNLFEKIFIKFKNRFKKQEKLPEGKVNISFEEVKKLPSYKQIKYLGRFSKEENYQLIDTFPNEMKIQLLQNACPIDFKFHVISQMPDNKKVENIQYLPETLRIKVMKQITSDELILIALEKEDKLEIREWYLSRIQDSQKLEQAQKIHKEKYLQQFMIEQSNFDEYNVIDIYNLPFDELKIQYIKNFKNVEDLQFILGSFQDYSLLEQVLNTLDESTDKNCLLLLFSKDDQVKLDIIENSKFPNKLFAVKCLTSDNLKINYLNEFTDEDKLDIIRTFKDKQCLDRALDTLKDKELANSLRENLVLNAKALKDTPIQLLEKKYVDILGLDKINLMVSDEVMVYKLLSLKDKELKIFEICFENSLKTVPRNNWMQIFKNLIMNIHNYSILIENIDDKKIKNLDIEKLTSLLQTDNFFEISSMDDFSNFEQIRERKCGTIIRSDTSTLEEKKNALLYKFFGQGLEYAESINKKFSLVSKSLEDSDERDFLEAIQLILSIKDERIIIELADKIQQGQIIDRGLVENHIKTAVSQLYQDTVLSTDNCPSIDPKEIDPRLEGIPVYSAGTNFAAIITSVGAYSKRTKGLVDEQRDFRKEWERPEMNVLHFCTSYIRNDMLGTAPIQSVCYGFSTLAPDSLLIQSPGDAYSNKAPSLVSYSAKQQFMAPDDLINETHNHTLLTGETYNELDYLRHQNGKKVVPDYLMAFKKSGKIAGLENYIIASKNWNNMPIVIVDVDKCLEKEMQELRDEISTFQKHPTLESQRRIIQKVNNNRVTSSDFASSMNGILEEIKNMEGLPHDERLSLDDLRKNDELITEDSRHSFFAYIRNVMNNQSKNVNQEIGEK